MSAAAVKAVPMDGVNESGGSSPYVDFRQRMASRLAATPVKGLAEPSLFTTSLINSDNGIASESTTHANERMDLAELAKTCTVSTVDKDDEDWQQLKHLFRRWALHAMEDLVNRQEVQRLAGLARGFGLSLDPKVTRRVVQDSASCDRIRQGMDYVDSGRERGHGVFGFISPSTMASTRSHVEERLSTLTSTYVFGMALEGGSRFDDATAFARLHAEAYVQDSTPQKRRFGRIPQSAHPSKQRPKTPPIVAKQTEEAAPTEWRPRREPPCDVLEPVSIENPGAEEEEAPQETPAAVYPTGGSRRAVASLKKDRRRKELRARAGL